MITYTAWELLALQPTDVIIPRTVSIFGFRLWRPRKQWAQRHEGVSSHHRGLPIRRQCSRSRSGTPQRQSRNCVRNLRSSGTPLLARPSWKTDFAARDFRHSGPAVWNSFPKTVFGSSSLMLFKSRLKSHLFHLAYNDRQ